MATVLNQIVAFSAVAPGATVTLANTVNRNGIPCLPDIIGRDNLNFSIDATPVGSITVTNHSTSVADCNVWLWQQHSFDRAYGGVNPPFLNMTPQPFILDGAAAFTGGGGSGGTQYVFVFRPGGIMGGNVYPTWAPLVAAMNAVAGPTLIFFDDSLAPCVIPAGAWNMAETSWVGSSANGSIVEVAEGALLSGLRTITTNMRVTFSGTTPPVQDFKDDDVFWLRDNSTITTTGAGPFFQVTGPDGGSPILNCVLDSLLVTGTVPVLAVGNTGVSLTVQGMQGGGAQDNTISCVPGSDVVLQWLDGSGVLSELQPGVSGGVRTANPDFVRFGWRSIVTSSTTAQPNDFLRVDPSGGPLTITLPPAFNNRALVVVVKNTTVSTNAISIAPAGGDSIDNGGAYIIADSLGAAQFMSDGDGNWSVVATDLTTAVAASTQYVFVFRPGGTTSANVYATWGPLVAAANGVQGQKVIEFDDSLSPCVIPVGTWNMTDCIWESSTAGNATVTIPQGVTFTRLRYISDGVNVVFTGTTAPVADMTGLDSFILNTGATITTSGAGPFFSLTDPTGTATIAMVFANSLITGTAPIVSVDNATASVNVIVGTLCNLQDNTIAITTPGGAAQSVCVNSSAVISQTQPAATASAVINFTRLRWNINPILTGSGTATANDLIECDPTGGPVTVALPPALGIVGQQITVKNISSSTNGITALPTGADTIDGFSAYATNGPYDSLIYVSDGVSNWSVISGVPVVFPTPPSPGPFFVFAPSGPQHDNVFNHWPDLMTALGTFAGLKTILFNSNFGPIVIPAGGPYDMTDVTWSGDLSIDVTVTIADGAQFAKLRNITNNLQVVYSGTAALAPIADLTGTEVLTIDSNATLTTSSSGPLVTITAPTSSPSVRLLNGAALLTGTAPVAVVAVLVAGPILTIEVGALATLQANTLGATVADTIQVAPISSSSSIDETQSSVFGGVVFVNEINHRMTVMPSQAGGAVTLTTGNVFVPCDPSAFGFPINLPSAFNNRGMAIVIKNVTGSTNAITINASGGDNIDSAGSLTLNTAFASAYLISNGVDTWSVVEGGGAAVGGGTQYTFVFQPGGAPGANVFDNWTALTAVLGTVQGPKLVQFDDTFSSPCVIPPGAYDMTNVTWTGNGASNVATAVDVKDGVTFKLLREITGGVYVTYSGAGSPAPIEDITDQAALRITDNASVTTAGSGPFVRISDPSTDGSTVVFCGSGGSIPVGSTAVIEVSAGGFTPVVTVGELGQIEDKTLACTGGGALALRFASTSGFIDESQPAATIPTILSQENWKLNCGKVASADITTTITTIQQIDTSAGGHTITLPPAFNNRGNTVIVKSVTASPNKFIVMPAGSDTIDHATSLTVSLPFGYVWLVSDGVSNWDVVSVAGNIGLSKTFTYTASGLEGSAFTITIPGGMVSTNYLPQISNGDVASLLTFGFPVAGKTVSSFKVISSAALTTGDVLNVFVSTAN